MKFKDIGKMFTKNLLITELILVGIIVIIGAFTFHFVEGWRILDSFYFIISTMSTIGLGDFLPQTDLGKGFFMFYAIIGVPFFVSIGGIILETRFRKVIKRYLNKVYKELREAEAEIQEIEDSVINNIKNNLQNQDPKQDKTIGSPKTNATNTTKKRWKVW